MSPTQLGAKLLSWASQIDDNTIEQARQTAGMPFVAPHVALMPDAHSGKGAAVGTVIPTLGAVIPAAVGVDIGCVDGDTEYLTPLGWKRMGDYTPGDLVMQYERTTGLGSFAEPERYIVKPATKFYHLRSKYGVDQMLTPDHKMIVWAIRGRERRREEEVMLAEEFVRRDRSLVQGYKAEFKAVFTLDPAYGKHWPEALVRVHVMTSADASLDGRKAILHLSKGRKVERAEKLLRDAGIDYSIGAYQSDNTIVIRYAPPYGKGLALFWSADAETLAVIADEVFHWDGNCADRVFFTRIADEADLVQYALTAAGFRSSKRADAHPRDGAIDYRVFAIDKTHVGIASSPHTPIEEVQCDDDAMAYCFTVPSGFLVLRRNGNIFITGNCGMAGIETTFTSDDIRDLDLAFLRHAIEKAIPLSPGNYNTVVDRGHTAARIAGLEELAVKDDVDLGHSPKWREQLGSLGGGNHFIELCLDEDDHVWLFLHSGSRGVGNKIAQKHIKIAQALCKKWWITLPNPDLAYLVEGTPEFVSYIKELSWAQRFAAYNREDMLDRFAAEFARWLEVDDHREVDRIVSHHNYTRREDHYGKSVWLTRKGAVDAHKGVKSMIPGSMGTSSFVVEGKGFAPALCSAPHGAGRRFSRTEARRRFTEEDLANRMRGIEYRHGAEWVDEIPDAYKPIGTVMEDADDLVTVLHELRQVMNVKGT